MHKLKRPDHRKVSLILLALGNSLDNAEGGLVNALFPMIRTALGLGLESLGLLTSIGRFSRMLIAPLWALAGDHFSRKTLLFVATGLWSLWTVASGFAATGEQLIWLYGIGALGTVAAEPLVNSLIADLYSDQERGRAFGTLRSLGALVLVASTPLIGLLTGSPEGWRWGMWLMGGLGSVSGVLILLFVKEPVQLAQRQESFPVQWSNLMALRGNKTLLWLIPSVALSTSLVLVSFLVTYLVDVRGLTNSEGTWALAATAVGFVFSSLAGGWLGDRFERTWPQRGRVWLMQLFLLAYAVTSALALQIAWPELWMTYVAFGVLGLVSAIGYSGCVLPMISKVSPPEVRTSVFGFLLSFVQGGATAGLSLLVGYWSSSAGLPTVMFWVGTFPYLVNSLLWFVFWKAYPRDSSSMRA